jgi:hypothetical protein
VAWSPPATPPPCVGGLSAVGHALDTGSHRPPLEDAPILSSLRPNPFCFPLLAAERHCQGHLHSSSPCRAALHNATLATPLRAPTSCRFKSVAAVLVCPASLPSRYFRPQGESTAGMPPASSLPPPSIAARMSRGTAESGHGTGALRPPRAPSSHHSTRQLRQPHRMTPSPSFHRHQGAPPWTDLPVSPRPPPTPQIGPPLRRGAPRPVSPPPRAASDRNRWPPPPARPGSFSPASSVGCQPEQAGPQGQFGWPM